MEKTIKHTPEELLEQHLFFLYDRRKTIFKDPKMFFAPIGDYLFFSCFSGFENPTLGVVMEWLDRCPFAKELDSNGELALMCWLAGSPLTGSSKCTYISRNGMTSTHPVRKHRGFWCTWHAFMHINRKYEEQKKTAEHYSLEEVIRLLEEQDKKEPVIK